MSNPTRLFSGDGIKITQHGNALDVNIASGSSGLPTGAATSAKQDTGNASLASIAGETALRDIGSPVRITGNAASQSVAIPATAKAFVCMPEGGPCRCEIGGAATAASTIYMSQESCFIYPITGGSQTLFCYADAGAYGNFRFLG